MPHPIHLGLQVRPRRRRLAVHHARDPPRHPHAERAHGLELPRVVGHQPHRADPQVLQNVANGAVLARVVGEAEDAVGVDGVVGELGEFDTE